MEVTPIYTVDRYAIGTGEQGPKTKDIHLKYLETAQGELENRKDWLTPIY
jgi:branched-chain amino acid aminotransferase